MSRLIERIGPIAQLVVSTLVIVAFIAVVGVLLATILLGIHVDFAPGVKEVLLVLVGVLAGSFKETTGYWLGSSLGSYRKDQSGVPTP